MGGLLCIVSKILLTRYAPKFDFHITYCNILLTQLPNSVAYFCSQKMWLKSAMAESTVARFSCHLQARLPKRSRTSPSSNLWGKPPELPSGHVREFQRCLSWYWEASRQVSTELTDDNEMLEIMSFFGRDKSQCTMAALIRSDARKPHACQEDKA
jgi:hypothetical protein